MSFPTQKILEGNITWGELKEETSEEQIYQAIRNGVADPEINHKDEKILLDRNGLNYGHKKPSYGENYKFSNREGLANLMAPIDAVHDIPYHIGRKTGKLNLGDKEAGIEETSGKTAQSISIMALLYDASAGISADLGFQALPDLPDDIVVPGAMAGYLTGSFLEGRGHGVMETQVEKGLEEFQDLDDYTVEGF